MILDKIGYQGQTVRHTYKYVTYNNYTQSNSRYIENDNLVACGSFTLVSANILLFSLVITSAPYSMVVMIGTNMANLPTMLHLTHTHIGLFLQVPVQSLCPLIFLIQIFAIDVHSNVIPLPLPNNYLLPLLLVCATLLWTSFFHNLALLWDSLS